jgi:uncharacterized protein
MIKIDVVFASANQQQIEIPVEVENNCTVIMAIKKSGILSLFPEIPFPPTYVGVFGKQVPLDHSLQAGNRIEIYRPLLIDPKQSRRNRVASATKC